MDGRKTKQGKNWTIVLVVIVSYRILISVDFSLHLFDVS